MSLWLQFDYKKNAMLGVLNGDAIDIYTGDLFNDPQAVGETCSLDDVDILMPCIPGKMIALWNNFYSRAEHEGWDIPPEPLYFVKTPNSFNAHNDVTAKDILKRDPSFPQWTRAKGFDTFGVFGPYIATDLDVDTLVIQSWLDGELLQNYPVTDMVFRPNRLVSMISQDMTLYPGDIIACGTGLNATAMEDGQTIEVSIGGVGVLSNKMTAARS